VLEVEQSRRGDEGGEEVTDNDLNLVAYLAERERRRLQLEQKRDDRSDNDRWAEFEKAVSDAANCSSIDAILNTPDFEIARDVIAMLRTRLQRIEPRHG
jgi:hypothetical protein